MGRRCIDITGQRYGRLTAINRIPKNEYETERRCAFWLCKCDCGNETIVSYSDLSCGCTKSCGCIKQKSSANNILKAKKHKSYREIYIENTGKFITDEYTIIFLDGNSKNTETENMIVVSKKTRQKMASEKFMYLDKELKKIAILACELSIKVNEAKKSGE